MVVKVRLYSFVFVFECERMATEYTVRNSTKCLKLLQCFSRCCKRKDEEEDGDNFASYNVALSLACCGSNASKGYDINSNRYQKKRFGDVEYKPDTSLRQTKETAV